MYFGDAVELRNAAVVWFREEKIIQLPVILVDLWLKSDDSVHYLFLDVIPGIVGC